MTRLQREVLDYITATYTATGIPPTVREVAAATERKSVGMVHHAIGLLLRAGYLEKRGDQRCYVPTLRQCPHCGEVLNA